MPAKKVSKIVDLPGGVRVTLEGPAAEVESVLREITDIKKPVPCILPPAVIERPIYPTWPRPWNSPTAWGLGSGGDTSGSVTGTTSNRLRITG